MRKAIYVIALAALVVGFDFGSKGAVATAGGPFHCNQVNMHPGALPNGQVSVAYLATLSLTPASNLLPVIVTGVTGTLPPGLGFVPGFPTNTVDLTGMPTATGTYTFTVELGGTYVFGTICKVSQTYTVTIF